MYSQAGLDGAPLGHPIQANLDEMRCTKRTMAAIGDERVRLAAALLGVSARALRVLLMAVEAKDD